MEIDYLNISDEQFELLSEEEQMEVLAAKISKLNLAQLKQLDEKLNELL